MHLTNYYKLCTWTLSDPKWQREGFLAQWSIIVEQNPPINTQLFTMTSPLAA